MTVKQLCLLIELPCGQLVQQVCEYFAKHKITRTWEGNFFTQLQGRKGIYLLFFAMSDDFKDFEIYQVTFLLCREVYWQFPEMLVEAKHVCPV